MGVIQQISDHKWRELPNKRDSSKWITSIETMGKATEWITTTIAIVDGDLMVR